MQGYYEECWDRKKIQGFPGAYYRNWALYGIFPEVKKEVKILDLGCGDGAVSAFLKNQGYDVTSVDISREALKKVASRGIDRLMLANAEKIPFVTSCFDIVFCGDLLEHLFNPETCLNEVSKVLKRNGVLVASFPNYGYYYFRIMYLLSGRIPCTEASGNPPWLWQHIRFYNPRIMRDLLFKTGFSVEKMHGVEIPYLQKPDLPLKKKLFARFVRFLQRITGSENLFPILILVARNRNP